MNRLLAIIPLAVVLIAAIVLGTSLLRPKDRDTDPAIGRQFPTVELHPVGEEPLFNPAATPPKGPALVNVWASWCVPCLAEHPMLLSLKQSGVTIYGVDWKEREEGGGQAFLDEHGSPFMAVGGDTGPAGVELGITGVPETFVVDGDGRIVAHVAGPLDPAQIQKVIRPALEAAAGDGAEVGQNAAPEPKPAG